MDDQGKINDLSVSKAEMEFIHRCNQTRGHVISCVAALEVTMDDYIASYFTTEPSRKFEIATMLLSTDKISFRSKASTLVEILKKKTSSQKEFEKLYPRINADFTDIAETRNRFAHDIIASGIPEEMLPTLVIALVQFKGSTSVTFYPKQAIDDFLVKIRKCADAIEFAKHLDKANP